MPQEMRDVGSFSLPLSFLDSASNDGGALVVSVSETPDGRRFVLYTVLRKDGKKLVASRSLYGVIRVVSKGVKRGLAGIRPRTPFAFVGNTLTYTCRLESGDPGKIMKQHWRVRNGYGDLLNVDAPQIDWTMRPYMDTWVGVMLEVEYTTDDGTTYVRYFYDEVYLRPIDASISDAYPTRQFFLSDTGHEKMPVTVSRKLYSYGDNRELVEADKFTFPEDSPGRLSVVRSRLSVVPGAENAAIENLTATQTIVIFKDFGSIEFFNELVLTYDYNDEHYEKKFLPLRSIIWGVYPYKASVLYEKNPPGILLGTSRKFTCKQIDLSINGKNCSVTGQTGQLCEITPTQILATSTMFPNSQALFTNVMLPIMVRKSGDGLEQLPLFQNFQTTLSYDKSTFLENGGIPCRAYFIAGWSTKDGKLRDSPPISWETFNLLAHPMGDWFSVKAFPNPAALVQVELELPSQEVYEGQETELPVTILPLPGMGTGKLTSDGGVIDLLDGYETQKLNTLTWAAQLLPAVFARESAKQAGPFQIAFKPVQGTGTYEITASASLEVKEKDTGSTAVVTGDGSTEVVVKDGFKITSPTEGAMFPVGFPIKIATNLDNNPGEEWKKIQWTIAPSLPFSQPTVAPWYLYPVKADSWALTANYTTPDNQQLTSVVHFTTKPVDISISPVRRVCAFPGSSTIDVSVTVSINGQVVEKPNTPVQWGSDGSMALVTVEWADITVPTKRGDFSHNSDSFTGQAAFISEGAMTVLATVTVAIQSKANKQGRDLGNTFTFPAVRADLWAVKNPMWSQPYAGDHPTQAISKSQRTFSFPSGNFVALGTDYSWGSDGLNPVMNLPPALNDGSVLAAKANQINFSWIRKGLPQASGATYVARFDKPEIAELFLSSTLEFGRDGSVLFVQVRFPVAVTPLEDHIVVAVDPQVFSVPAGAKKTLRCLVSSKDVPLRQRDDSISILGGEYTLSMQKDVVWTVAQDQPQRLLRQLISNDYSFAEPQPGSFTITASASLSLQEKKSSSPAPATMNQVSATAKADVIASHLITEIMIREKNNSENLTSFTTSYRKVTTIFEAIGFSQNEEIGPVSVDWFLEGGVVASESIRGKILKDFNIKDYKVGVLNGSYAKLLDSPTASFTSYFSTKNIPNGLSLIASKNNLTTKIEIKIRQPVVYVNIVQAGGEEEIPIITEWKRWVLATWEKENLFEFKFKPQDFQIINNEPLGLPWDARESLESQMKAYYLFAEPVVSFPDLLHLIVHDYQANGFYKRAEILTRQLEEVIKRGRKKERINLFIAKDVVTSIKLNPTFGSPSDFVAGWTVSKKNYFRREENEKRIDDNLESVICQSTRTIVLSDPFYQATLAHELGHLLIQSNDEHTDFGAGSDEENIMNQGHTGNKLNEKQFIWALGYEKSENTPFILEE